MSDRQITEHRQNPGIKRCRKNKGSSNGWDLEEREECGKMRQKGQAWTGLYVTLRGPSRSLYCVLKMHHSAASLTCKHYTSSHGLIFFYVNDSHITVSLLGSELKFLSA